MGMKFCALVLIWSFSMLVAIFTWSGSVWVIDDLTGDGKVSWNLTLQNNIVPTSLIFLCFVVSAVLFVSAVLSKRRRSRSGT